MSFNLGENFQLRPRTTAPEMLALEVTPGLQQEQSPTPISLCHDLFIEGDQVEENSEQYRSNSETRLDMHR
jgi:hypothetical protein